LPIEMGRFFSIDRSERICDLCNKEELGDEFHYLFNCTFFKDERKKIIPEYLYNVPIFNIRIIKVLLNFLR
jgi:hypothetical protein